MFYFQDWNFLKLFSKISVFCNPIFNPPGMKISYVYRTLTQQKVALTTARSNPVLWYDKSENLCYMCYFTLFLSFCSAFFHNLPLFCVLCHSLSVCSVLPFTFSVCCACFRDWFLSILCLSLSLVLASYSGRHPWWCVPGSPLRRDSKGMVLPVSPRLWGMLINIEIGYVVEIFDYGVVSTAPPLLNAYLSLWCVCVSLSLYIYKYLHEIGSLISPH